MIDEHPRSLAPVIAIRRPAKRGIVRLHPALAGRYLSLVAALVPVVEGTLSGRVLANRVAAASVDPPVVRLHRWRIERARFSRRLVGLTRDAGALVFIDVRRCYASIAPEVVGGRLAEIGIDRGTSDGVAAFLESLRRYGVEGLPVGPTPSAVLANAVLGSLDRVLESSGVAHLRWVDDVVASVAGPEDAEELLALIDGSLARLGLERNVGKTRIVVDPASVREGFSPSGVD